MFISSVDTVCHFVAFVPVVKASIDAGNAVGATEAVSTARIVSRRLVRQDRCTRFIQKIVLVQSKLDT